MAIGGQNNDLTKEGRQQRETTLVFSVRSETMAADISQYMAVTNIPSHFHAADLRAHFSSLVESSSFVCFHFRHRPEKVNRRTDDKNNDSEVRKLCCVVKIVKKQLESLLRYNKQNWTNIDGDFLADECQLSEIKLTHTHNGVHGDGVEEEKLLQMPELTPPDLMPQGNVGTPTLVFLDLIQQCLLPHNLINKLKLKFPKTAARRIYSNVDFDYGTPDSQEHSLNVEDEINRHTYSRHNRLTTRLFAKNKVPCDIDENQSVANESLHGNHAQRSSDEKVLLEVDSEEESRGEDVVAGVDRVLRSSSKEMVEEAGSDPSSLNIEEPTSTTSYKHRPQSVPPNSPGANISSAYQGYSPASTLGHSENRSSCTSVRSDTFLKPAALPRRESQKLTNKERKRMKKEEQLRIKQLKAENIEERLIAVEKRYHNDDDAEDWDRHEASEDDPSNQERNKERLFDEEIEQPWEKGGPGVVFYTDAVFWQEREGDFDEQTTDDLDVDFSVYEGEGDGDKDIQDFLKIRQEKRYREGYDDTDRFSVGIGKRLPESTNCRSRSRIGTFESHSKGIGRKVMERQGWKEGQGLGRSMPGIVNALKGEGQGPHNKRGIGYTKLKPVTYGSSALKKPRNQTHFITTIFDDPKTTDPKEPLLLRSEPSTLKHRQSHLSRFT